MLNTVENLSWSKVHRIWKRKSGKQGRKYLAVSNTVENIWSKIFDLKKAVFACETPAFSQKSLAINCCLFLEPHLSQITIPIKLGYLFCQWLIKSLFGQITTPMETHFSSVKRGGKKKSRNENWLDTASKFYIHRNFQWLKSYSSIWHVWQSSQFCQFCFYWFLSSLSSQLLILSFASGYFILF